MFEGYNVSTKLLFDVMTLTQFTTKIIYFNIQWLINHIILSNNRFKSYEADFYKYGYMRNSKKKVHDTNVFTNTFSLDHRWRMRIIKIFIGKHGNLNLPVLKLIIFCT